MIKRDKIKHTLIMEDFEWKAPYAKALIITLSWLIRFWQGWIQEITG